MKKLKLYYILFSAVLPIFIFVIVILLFTMDVGQASDPMNRPATPETVLRYGTVCSEIGAPWDIVLLADVYFADTNGKGDIEDVNPIHTALQFLILEEYLYKWEIVGYEESSDDDELTEEDETVEEDEPTEGDEPTEEDDRVPIYDWVMYPEFTTTYKGKSEVLSYGGLSDDDIADMSPSEIISSLEDVAEAKYSEESEKYELSISVNTDFEEVLLDYIGLERDITDKVIDFYNAKYLVYLYFGGTFTFIGDYELPEIVVGNVTRQQLAEVAAAIIGHPYYWGGKWTQEGVPAGGLDCSGFIDWVYYQCFGMAVNGINPQGNLILNGTAIQYYSSEEISESELQIGDLGFYYDPVMVTDYNHVGIYIGKINGKNAFIHCGGSSFGTPDLPSGRVGISINIPGVENNINPLTGETFEPPMPGTDFKLFRRPKFQFLDDVS